MDINWQMGDDLQLWGHLHGYGDTAECIPDDDIIVGAQNANANNNNSFTYRGLQARGWHWIFVKNLWKRFFATF